MSLEYHSHHPDPVLPQGSESEMLGLCILLAASASRSEHPLSRGCEEGAALLAGCSPAELLEDAPEISDFEVLMGVGVKFRMGTSLNVSVGYLEYLSSDQDATDWAQDQRSRGCTIAAVQANGALVCFAPQVSHKKDTFGCLSMLYVTS